MTDTNSTTPTKLPTISGTCPHYSAGQGNLVTFAASGGSIQAQVWAGSPTGGGPLILYWNGTASSPTAEIPLAFDINAVTSAGGLIVGFVSGSRTGATGADTGGDLYWYSTDVNYADQAVACAIDQYKIDTRHIHVAGYSAGGLQTVYMWAARSSYVASVISYSGGYIIINAPQASDAMYENKANTAAAIGAHGAAGSDALGADFASATQTWEGMIKMGGGFSIDCNDGGSHLDFFTKRAPGLKAVAYTFFAAHPYGVKPEPWTSLPSGFPTYCKID
jgi:poly(3-hydroxybutyrate) depolymerase